VLAVLAWAAPAAADDAEPIRVVFRAHAGCPDEAAFTGQIMARTQRARLAAPGEVARTFSVIITPAGGARSRGKLVIDDPKGPSASRSVSGTCDEVVSALGLVAALAIDPHASTAPKLPPAPPSAPPPSAPPRPREPLPPPPRYDALPWWGPISEPLPVIPDPAPPPRWRLAWGFHAGGASAVAPGLARTLGGFVEVALDGGGVLSPAFRLGMLQADSGAVVVAPGEAARLALAAARVEGCPVRLAPVSWLSFHPCIFFEGGALQASGTARVSSVPSTTRPWAEPGVSARVAGEVVGRAFLEVEGGVGFPLVRDTFYFAPATTAHAVPVAGGFFSGGIGTHFP